MTARRPVDSAAVQRAKMIAAGVLRPVADTDSDFSLRRVRLPPGTPMLRIDEAGVSAAERHQLVWRNHIAKTSKPMAGPREEVDETDFESRGARRVK